MNKQSFNMFFFGLILSLVTNIVYGIIAPSYNTLYNCQPNSLLIVAQQPEKYGYIFKALQKHNIPYQEVSSVYSNDTTNLYLLFDLATIPTDQLPMYYIAYQSLDFKNRAPTTEYLAKLNGAIAIWDPSLLNIDSYKATIKQYYYFPAQFMYPDPIILPCFLPLKAMASYTEILKYSNSADTDIASHLPTLYVHSFLQNPDLIVEAGIRGGESTKVFKKNIDLNNAHLIGIDVDPAAGSVYDNLHNALFLCIDDVTFPQLYATNKTFNERDIDIIFIDTSHHYKHTMAELKSFVPTLSNKGMLILHDSYMSPLPHHQWHMINGTVFGNGWDNQRGVIRAITDYFSISYDEKKYSHFTFKHHGISWQLIHYPFCNGLTLIKKIS